MRSGRTAASEGTRGGRTAGGSVPGEGARGGRATGAGAPGERSPGERAPGARGAAPKQDRSRATRQRLLASAVTCLAERGWTGSTVTVVAEHAGVSRGAAQHHFPTREDLFTAAVEYVAEERSRALRELPTPASVYAAVETLVGLYTGPLFRAALHLWVAASNEPQLGPRVTALEARIGRETHRMAVALLGADESRPGVRETVQGLLDTARGLGLANLLTDDSARRRGIVAQWARLVEASLRS
ncbi:TetR/AcrR family transcriptional regulator [Streptomyces diacarni]|uniref:TetR/AcrR family transcriptional regulator n=1 Tax=Streptomyces diacarni TaxID=2800381 RepID=UPI003F4D0E34